jgi:transcriptional regulator with XRE-family HTH domain
MTKFRDVVGDIVGRNITLRRQQLGITREQFSRCLGVESSVLDQYETGDRRVDAKLLLSIGMILDVPPTYFFSNCERKDIPLAGPDKLEPDYANDRELFLREGVALNHAFARISNSANRQKLIEIALALAEIDRIS